MCSAGKVNARTLVRPAMAGVLLPCILRLSVAYAMPPAPSAGSFASPHTHLSTPAAVHPLMSPHYTTLHRLWRVLAVAAGDVKPSPFVALERNFDRWGLLAFVAPPLPASSSSNRPSSSSAPQPPPPLLTVRKSVGKLSSIVQPRFNLTKDMGASYFADVTSSLADLPVDLAKALSTDGQPGFAEIAAALAPQRDVVGISNAADVVKYVWMCAYGGGWWMLLVLRVLCSVDGVNQTR